MDSLPEYDNLWITCKCGQKIGGTILKDQPFEFTCLAVMDGFPSSVIFIVVLITFAVLLVILNGAVMLWQHFSKKENNEQT